jgi:hypothetical protein
MTSDSIFDATPALLDRDFDVELLDAVVAHWSSTFAGDERRDDIARELGLSPPLASTLEIGLSDRSLGLRIPSRELKAGRLLRERLVALGILRASGHEAFRGCVVVPVRRDGRVVALFARRLERGSSIQWASGLPGGVFTQRVTPSTAANDGSTLCLVTTSMLDALAVLGALSEGGAPAFEGIVTVLAPARPRGYAVKDLKEIAGRTDALVVLGRGGEELVDRLRDHGATTTSVGSDVNLARTLTSSIEPGVVLAELLGGERTFGARSVISTPIAPFVETESFDPGTGPPEFVSAPPIRTMTPGRDEIYVQIGPRRWRIRGARARGNVEGDRLSVALSVVDDIHGRFHLDTLDLYSARARSNFLDAVASELHVTRDVLITEMGHVLHAAEVARDEPRPDDAPLHEMSAEERDEALTWLQGPDLLNRLAHDLGGLGVVGERMNLMVCYLAALSRKCERPFGVLVQSSSAGGKSTLVEAVTALVPPEDLVSLSSITAQALYYLGATRLRQKVLFIAEERGSSRSAYALKLLVSEGRVAIASTGNDADGLPRTKSYETAGPLSLMMTTTSTTLDPELANRLVVLGVDEDASQTSAIIQAQRTATSLAGLASLHLRDALRRRHHNVQRLLEPVVVVIPEGPISFPSSATRHRRDHVKFLSMVMSLAMLHQHQRVRRTVLLDGVAVDVVEAAPQDVEFASELSRHVLVRDAEGLAPQVQRLLSEVRAFVVEQADHVTVDSHDVEVTRRQLRERLGWSVNQVRDATDRLVELEYLVVSGGGRGRCRSYRLVADVESPVSNRATHVGAVGEVGDLAPPTCGTSPSGEKDELVPLVPDSPAPGDPEAHGDVSYTETSARASSVHVTS